MEQHQLRAKIAGTGADQHRISLDPATPRWFKAFHPSSQGARDPRKDKKIPGSWMAPRRHEFNCCFRHDPRTRIKTSCRKSGPELLQSLEARAMNGYSLVRW